MAAPATTKATIKKQTIAGMKKLGVYYPETDREIDIYAGMVEEYYDLTREIADSEFKYSSGTGAGGQKKSAICSAREALRRDILAYADKLCITPRAIRDAQQKPPEKESKLEALLHDS